jgi:hypothetical protein
MIEEPGVSNVGSAAHRYAGLPIRSVTWTMRPRGIVEHSVRGHQQGQRDEDR